jgi:hypothetical protein
LGESLGLAAGRNLQRPYRRRLVSATGRRRTAVQLGALRLAALYGEQPFRLSTPIVDDHVDGAGLLHGKRSLGPRMLNDEISLSDFM